jgi:hypothetical protein
MLRPWLSSLLALLLLIAPATAQEFSFNSGGLLGGRPAPSAKTMFRAPCLADTSNATNYNFNPVFTGVDETWPGIYVAVALSEDSATAFSINNFTNGQLSWTERADQGGTGIVNAYVGHSPQYTQPTQSLFQLQHSEAVTSAVLCAWFITGFSGPFVADSFVADDDAASGALVLTTGTTDTTGWVFGGCLNSGVADSTTWAVLTEREDTQSAEEDYSTADAAGTGASMSNTCDWTGANAAAGAALAIH